MDTLTFGNRVDALIHSFEEISSTQLYTLIVTLTVLISALLLGKSSDLPATLPKPVAEPQAPKRRVSEGPDPNWQIFAYVNYAIVAAFGLSVVEFARNASNYYDNALFMFLAGWSVFLVYFFGFFGVSFVHQNLPDR